MVTSVVVVVVAKPCLTLATPWTIACQTLSMGILQTRILKWAAIHQHSPVGFQAQFDIRNVCGVPRACLKHGVNSSRGGGHRRLRF